MAWITVSEPYATPPRVAEIEVLPDWAGALDIDRGFGELRGVCVDGGVVAFDGCEETAIHRCRLAEVEVTADAGSRMDIVHAAFVGCELHQLRIESIRNTTVTGSKLVGVDFGDARLLDVVFDECVLLAANLRGANLQRVLFRNCTLDDADAYGCEMADVDFAGSSLHGVNIDRATAKRVDLRRATALGLTGVSRLAGYLITEEQIPALMEVLALASGVDIQAVPD